MAMDAIKLAATKRDASKKAKHLRADGVVPGVMYGHGTENRIVSMVYNEFARAYRGAGESTLIDLAIDGEAPVKVLVKDIQVAPLSNRFTHVDFYQVNLKEKLKVEIALNFVGEAPAVKELGGTLVKSLDNVDVECLPTDLVHAIDVDLTTLKTFDDMLRVSDLKVPAGIEILNGAEEVIATVEAPMTEEQLKALESSTPADVTAIKTESEEKKAADEAKKAAEEAAKE